jgi:hypothetical protein
MQPETAAPPLNPARRYQPRPAEARCDGCTWHRSGDQGLMEDAASRHSGDLGHQVRVLTAGEVIFTPAGGPR